jgi:hypothetical protein
VVELDLEPVKIQLEPVHRRLGTGYTRIGSYPGRTDTLVNDRLRRETEIYGGRTHGPYTICVYGAIRSETESVYGDREKIRSD